MTEIKTLIATEEPLEKQVSQVNLSQAYLSGQVCSCLVQMKKWGCVCFSCELKVRACLPCVGQNNWTSRGDAPWASLSLLLNTASASLCFILMWECSHQVGFHLELQQTQCVMWDNTRRSVCVCDLSFPGDLPPVKGCLASLLGSLKQTKGQKHAFNPSFEDRLVRVPKF